MKAATIMIPGRPVSSRAEIERFLLDLFGGFTRGSASSGVWRSPIDNVTHVDRLVSYEVAYEEPQLERLVSLFHRISGHLRMPLYTRIDDHVHFIDGDNPLKDLLRAVVRPATKSTATAPRGRTYDAFISHASEDKHEFVGRLAKALVRLGHSVWYDEFELTVGDSLRRSIDRGLAHSRFGVVVLSPSFFAKNWPQYELDGLVQKEMRGRKVILPLWHKVSREDVLAYSPTLADRVALSTSNLTIDQVAQKLGAVFSPPNTRLNLAAAPRQERPRVRRNR